MASALLVDYVLTVAVSVSAGVANLGSVVPYVAEHKVGIAVAAVVVLTAMNLRGIRESGTAFAIPTYGFMIVIMGMILTGLFRIFVLDDDLQAPSAGLTIVAEADLTGFALFFLLLRAFSSGCGRADRGGGHLQRRARLQAAEEPQRRHHAAAARRHRRSPCSSASSRWPG